MQNLLQTLPEDLSEEVIETLVQSRSVCIERIVSNGQASPEGFWYDQSEEEWVVLLVGAARLQFEGDEPIAMKPGDAVLIAAHRRHRVEWTMPDAPTIWLAIHFSGD